MTAVAAERGEGAAVATTELALSLGAITEEAGYEATEDGVDVLAADIHLVSNLNGQVAV